ncbi:hypothetical protein BJ508DRAFT_74058 [Ascobolus immersus RN42]|uniref:Uncharacterized protein n=1 Tax=Ascobolus immersus RN42 TaxID=1160509 RepID=A0A3N4HDP8_ASCIM|nr:hypothetical protein BJ508DRAFT_74058 [Ascobolus immersus RN42]
MRSSKRYVEIGYCGGVLKSLKFGYWSVVNFHPPPCVFPEPLHPVRASSKATVKKTLLKSLLTPLAPIFVQSWWSVFRCRCLSFFLLTRPFRLPLEALRSPLSLDPLHQQPFPLSRPSPPPTSNNQTATFLSLSHSTSHHCLFVLLLRYLQRALQRQNNENSSGIAALETLLGAIVSPSALQQSPAGSERTPLFLHTTRWRKQSRLSSTDSTPLRTLAS